MYDKFSCYVIDIIKQDEFCFLHCITDRYGAILLKLSDNLEVQNNQINQLKRYSKVDLSALRLDSHMVVKSIDNVRVFDIITHEKFKEFLDVIFDLVKVCYKAKNRDFDIEILNECIEVVLGDLELAKYALIKLLLSIFNKFDFYKCGLCKGIYDNYTKFYFNPITLMIECETCQQGESFYINKKSLKALKDIKNSNISNVLSLNLQCDTVNYLLFLLIEGVAHNYENINSLEKFNKRY